VIVEHFRRTHRPDPVGTGRAGRGDHLGIAYRDTAVRAQLSSGPAQRAIEHAGEPRTRDAMIEAFAGSRRDDGSYRQENSFHYLIARA